MTEKEKAIFDRQSESTKAALLRQKSRSPVEDFDYANRSIPKEAQCLKEDGSIDLNVRAISSEEEAAYLLFRRRRGTPIEETRAQYLKSKKLTKTLENMIDTPHVTPTEKIKESAIDSFMMAMDKSTLKNKFKALFQNVFKPSYAEVVAEHMKKAKDE